MQLQEAQVTPPSNTKRSEKKKDVLILTLTDENNTRGVRMVLREYTSLTFEDFIKQAVLRLKSTRDPVDVQCENGDTVTQVTDLLTGDKLRFIYAGTAGASGTSGTSITSGTANSPRETNTHSSSSPPRTQKKQHPPSFTFECIRLLLTFVLFIAMHQGFLWWMSRDNASEKDRVHSKINALKYPTGFSDDL